MPTQAYYPFNRFVPPSISRLLNDTSSVLVIELQRSNAAALQLREGETVSF